MPSYITLRSTTLRSKTFIDKDKGDKIRFSFVGEFLNLDQTHTIQIGFDDFSNVALEFNDVYVPSEGRYFKIDGFIMSSASNTIRICAELKFDRSDAPYVRYKEISLKFSSDHTFEIYSFGTGIALHADFLEFLPRYEGE